MEQSPNLYLPYIMPSQAQKHVTHNEAVRMLDALVQLAVLDRHLTMPPPAPGEGDRYIVADGASGAWSGKDRMIAAWQDAAWAFLPPRAGWQAWATDEERLLVFDGAQWSMIVTESLGAAILGVNATADEENRLAVAATSAIFSHDGGDHRLIVNKAGNGNTASIVFQTAYSGRAEIGLAGDDRFWLKVSGDGSTFRNAVVVDNGTGAVSLPATPSGQVNLLINGAFAINQRGFAGGSLSAGNYGHDRWKAGSGGCSYTVSSGVVSHTSGPLVQVVESPDLAGATVTLSVGDLSGGSLNVSIEGETGSISAGSGRRGVTLTVPGGSTGNVTVILTPAGGAVSYRHVQLNIGNVALKFERRHQAVETALCQRYYLKSYNLAVAPGTTGTTGDHVLFCAGSTGVAARALVAFPCPMRANPSVTIYHPDTGNAGQVRNVTAGSNQTASSSSISETSFWGGASSGQANNDQIRFHWTADAEL